MDQGLCNLIECAPLELSMLVHMHGQPITILDHGDGLHVTLACEKQLEKKLGPQVPIMSTHGRSAEAPIMAVGSAEEQCIMSTSMRLRLKRRPNIIKDAAQSFSSSGVWNPSYDSEEALCRELIFQSALNSLYVMLTLLRSPAARLLTFSVTQFLIKFLFPTVKISIEQLMAQAGFPDHSRTFTGHHVWDVGVVMSCYLMLVNLT
ncbi:unnamed protein product [Sphagnum jensenii]|uniref:Uncharacterized protein n=1 Tax=Sphagnum jensenii TaxID=128206 RepID=A0ABP1B7U0_9BRYO